MKFLIDHNLGGHAEILLGNIDLAIIAGRSFEETTDLLVSSAAQQRAGAGG